MFWRGMATGTAEKQEQKFAMAASKLLAKFPSTAK